MLGSIRGGVRFREPLKIHTSLRLGGPADVFITPGSVDDIRHALSFADREQMPLAVIGAGTHLLVTERGFRGVVLKLEGALRRVEVHGEEMVAGAGADLFTAIREGAAANLGGLAHLVGSAGTVGGALAIPTAEAPLSGIVSAVYFVRPDGELDELKPGSHGYGDRPLGPPGHIMIGCRIRLERQSGAAMMGEVTRRLRRRPLPQTLTLAGSVVWKDPPGDDAGRLIEQAGLGGKRVNGVEVLSRHPAVVVNRGGGTAVDVLALMQHVRERVQAHTGIRLEPAIRTLGDPL